MNLEEHIRSIMDYPKEGINFRDITPLLAHPEAFAYAIDQMIEHYRTRDIDRVAAFDARGFLFGPTIAYNLGVPFVPIRKAGKLPYETIGESYGLEYGKDRVEIHTDAVSPGDRVLLVDDLLATGGTMKAGATLVERLGGVVESCAFLIELTGIGGQERLQAYDTFSLLTYEA